MPRPLADGQAFCGLGGGGAFLCCILLSVILAAHLPYNRLYAPVVRRTASIMQGFPYRAES